jgi:pilus assembly protein Flp/PilA
MLNIINHTMRKLGVDEKGASAVEYAILVGIIGVALGAAAGTFSTELATVFTTLMSKVGLGAAA